MNGNGAKYKITNIEYCPSRSGQPCIVTVEKTYNGGEKKEMSCDVYVNHAYENGRFIPKTSPVTGEKWDYKKFDFKTPVKTTVSTNGVGEFVEREFKRMFQEQREQEGW